VSKLSATHHLHSSVVFRGRRGNEVGATAPPRASTWGGAFSSAVQGWRSTPKSVLLRSRETCGFSVEKAREPVDCLSVRACIANTFAQTPTKKTANSDRQRWWVERNGPDADLSIQSRRVRSPAGYGRQQPRRLFLLDALQHLSASFRATGTLIGTVRAVGLESQIKLSGTISFDP
jgi:hypothetical protein